MTPLRVGLAGCGLIGGGPLREGRPLTGNHAQACRDSDGIALVAAADPDAGRCAAFAAYWGLPRVYADAGTMLAAEKLDLLIVATPHRMYREIQVRAGVVAIDMWGCLPQRGEGGEA